jgi:predicted TPR repeat methyltransferase
MNVRALDNAVASMYDAAVVESRYVGPAWLSGVLPGMQEAARVVDFGCANGNLGRLLRTRFPRGHITGFDVSELMIAEAQRGGSYDDLFVHDLNLPVTHVADGSVNLVVALGFVEFLDNPATYLAEVSRVLAPSGEFVVSFQEYWPERAKLAPKLTRSGEVVHTAYSHSEVEAFFRTSALAVRSMESTTAYVSRSGFACTYLMVQGAKAACASGEPGSEA